MPRVEYAGAIYHVTVRMAGHAWETGRALDPAACLFRDHAERERFIEQLGARVKAYGVRLYAYALMLTHVHLYLETPRANLGRFMHSLGTAYTVYSNLRRQRHGPLVGRYKAKPVEGDRYHRALSRYVHLNPVRTTAARKLAVEERLKRLRDYPWSSYRAYVGSDRAPDWLACGPILAFGGTTPAQQRREYRRFVEAALMGNEEEEGRLLKSSAPAIGGEAFVNWIREQLIERGRGAKCAADTELRKLARAQPVARVLEVAAGVLGVRPEAFRQRRRSSDVRGVAARALCRWADLTQREAAAVLGMQTGAAVGQQLQRLERRLSHDRRLRRCVADIDRVVNEEKTC